MSRPFNAADRILAAKAIFDIDTFWSTSFADTGLSDLNYCDLFTQMWLNREAPPQPKTELYALMPNISRRTAVKYVQNAIDQGMLAEQECDTDRRIRLIRLTPAACAKVERFLDHTCACFSSVGNP
ncbi:MAG: MarR family transcriptional regulator [Gammaproteobacteria bacterium HGW-Gammaproteobacteria-11]|nr:MAG: MarR family transcriptional regulator [Gammaproteobacteria bacterium HGW-Gammaproteobacteria-11]